VPRDPHQRYSGGGGQGNIKMLWIPNKVLLLLSAFLLLAFACFLTAVTYCGTLSQGATGESPAEGYEDDEGTGACLL